VVAEVRVEQNKLSFTRRESKKWTVTDQETGWARLGDYPYGYTMYTRVRANIC